MLGTKIQELIKLFTAELGPSEAARMDLQSCYLSCTLMVKENILPILWATMWSQGLGKARWVTKPASWFTKTRIRLTSALLLLFTEKRQL